MKGAVQHLCSTWGMATAAAAAVAVAAVAAAAAMTLLYSLGMILPERHSGMADGHQTTCISPASVE